MLDDQFGGSPTDDLTSGPDNINADRSASMYRRILLIVAIVVCLILGIYFRHFHRLPTEDILAANLARQSAAAAEDSNDDSVADNPTKRSRRDWDQWIRRNRFVSIGKLFDKCGNVTYSRIKPHVITRNVKVDKGKELSLCSKTAL